jgi:hypothetical protein
LKEKVKKKFFDYIWSFLKSKGKKKKIPHAATSTASSVPPSIYTDQIVRNESELLTTVQHLPVVSVPYATKDSDTGSALVHILCRMVVLLHLKAVWNCKKMQ